MTAIEIKQGRYKPLWTVGIFFASNTVIQLLERAIGFPLSPPFEFLLSRYREILDYAMAPLERWFLNILTALNSYFPFHLHMTPNWKYIFVPMFLYFNTDFKINIDRKRYASLIVGIFFGSLIALFSGVRLGTDDLIGALASELMLPMLGFVLFLFLQSLTTALFNPHGDQGFLKTFKYYLVNTTMAGATYACLSVAVGFMIVLISPTFGESSAVAIVMLTYVVLMSCYWIAQAKDVAQNDFRSNLLPPGVTVEDRLRSLGSYKFGMIVFYTMLSVLTLLGANWVILQLVHRA